MARQRKTPTQTEPQQRRVTMATTELNADLINQLLSSSKQRGLYDAELKQIVESGVKGVQVNLEDGAFAGKKAQSVKTGLDNARKKLAEDVRDTIRVIMQDDQVFVINTAA